MNIQKYKDKDNKALYKLAEKWFNLFIRLRDTDENGYGVCISSGQSLKVPSRKAQAGHYYSGGKFKRLKFNEDNVHLQGLSDNYYNHGNESMYRLNLIDKIGRERVEELDRIARDRSVFKMDRFFLIDTIERYKAKANELKKTKMY